MEIIYDWKSHKRFARIVFGKRKKLRNKVFASLILVLIGTSVIAQHDLTLEDAILNRFTELSPERLTGLKWIPNSHLYSFVEEDALQVYNAEKTKLQFKVELSELNEASGGKFNLDHFPQIDWMSEDKFGFDHEQNRFSYTISSGSIEILFTYPAGAEFISINEQNTKCAYVKAFDLFILDRDGIEKQITTDGGDGIVYGQAVHRNEFGITGGMFWSGDGQKLAFYRMDESMVDEYPIVDISVLPASTTMIRYPMAGRKSHHVTIGIVDASDGAPYYLETGEPLEQYLCSVTWNPSNAEIYVAHLNRDQNHMKLKSYSVKSGEFSKTLFEEKDEEYVEPEHGPVFLPWDDSKFLWFSERDGYNHLYLYSTDGTMLRQMTSGLWEVLSIDGFNRGSKSIVVRGTGEALRNGPELDETRNGTQSYTYVINTASGAKKPLDDRLGTHSDFVSSDGTFVIDQFTNLETPLEYNLYNSSEKRSTIHTAANPLDDYTIGTTELGQIVGSDGSALYTRIIKPSDFDPQKKYPVLIYVYGGPHAQLVTNRFLAGAPLWMHWFAEKGYIVATVDNRGSAHRGLEFEQATFQHLGEAEMEDQRLFADFLKSQPYIDGDRMAVHGWSYGGFMTTNMLLTFPGLFKAGVAGGPVIDWKFYEVMYTERYMDTPETNPEGYAKTSLLNKAENLEDNLLIIHGTSDPVVVWQQSLAFVKKCVDQGIQLDYFVYPGHPHNVRGKDRIHLMYKVLNYIEDKLNEN